MSRKDPGGIVQPKGAHRIMMRGFLFLTLGLFCLYYLAPLIIMIATSLKSLDEIRAGSLISLPREVTFDAWAKTFAEKSSDLEFSGSAPGSAVIGRSCQLRGQSRTSGYATVA